MVHLLPPRELSLPSICRREPAFGVTFPRIHHYRVTAKRLQGADRGPLYVAQAVQIKRDIWRDQPGGDVQ